MAKYKVKVDRGKVKNGEPHKFESVDWFDINKIPGDAHSQIQNFIKLYRHKLFS